MIALRRLLGFLHTIWMISSKTLQSSEVVLLLNWAKWKQKIRYTSYFTGLQRKIPIAWDLGSKLPKLLHHPHQNHEIGPSAFN